MLLDFRKYHKHLRTLPCRATGVDGSTVHHLKTVGLGRNRNNPMWAHWTGVSLSPIVHAEVETQGIKYVEKKYSVNLWKWALIDLAKWIFQQNKVAHENRHS